MNPYKDWLKLSGSSNYQELYSKLENIAKYKLGLDKVPFPLSALEHPPGKIENPDINCFIVKCNALAVGDDSEAQAIKLIKHLKENPPSHSYENPKLSDEECSQDEDDLMYHIFYYGIDLPGSMHNPFGHLQYFSSFFIDMFFGNLTESMDHITTLSKEELEMALKEREGYCQFCPIFAPIVGLCLVNLEESIHFTTKEKQKIRTMYSGCNENKHLEILSQLIELGADVNSHDINGYTPLHYSVLYQRKDMIEVLLKHGANPNSQSRNLYRPLTLLKESDEWFEFRMINVLIDYGSVITDKEEINMLRYSVETFGSKDLAVRVREAHPRERGECEKCEKPDSKKCSACGLVSYCTPVCQKLDWKFHKVTCKNKKIKK